VHYNLFKLRIKKFSRRTAAITATMTNYCTANAVPVFNLQFMGR